MRLAAVLSITKNAGTLNPKNEPNVPETPLVTKAVVRGVPATYDRCIRSDTSEPIDVALAMEQHERYCGVLRSLGIDLIEIAPDERFPDCCFVEDPVLVLDDFVIAANMGAIPRRGEGEAVHKALSGMGKRVVEIEGPGTLEGGDVIRMGDKILVGLTGRTDRGGLDKLRAILEPEGYDVGAVEVQGALHLKSVCAYLGDGHIVLSPGYVDKTVFAGCDTIEIAAADAYSVNCIATNGIVTLAEGFPETRKKIEHAGFETIEVPTSEFRKGDGGLSCLSLRF